MKFYNKKQCFSKILSVFLPLMLLFMLIPAVALSGGGWDSLGGGAGSAQNSAAEAATPMLANMQTSALLENPNLSNVAFGPGEPLAPMPLAVGETFQDAAGVWYKVLTEFAPGTTGTPGQNTVEVTVNVSYSANLLTIPATVTNAGTVYEVVKIANSAFYENTNITSVTIPNSVTSIGYYAFYRCTGLTSVTLAQGLTSIGNNAFSRCERLTSVTIPNSVTSIGYYAFAYCSGLTSATLPQGLTTIESDMFNGCRGLTSVTIPNSVTTIGMSAFSGCTGLTSVIIPNSVTSIGILAFFGSWGLTSVTIPNSVTSIGQAAFQACTRLTEIYFMGAVPPSFGSNVFSNVPNINTSTLYYPSGTEASYDPATFAGGAFSNWNFVAYFAPGFGTNPSTKTLLEGDGTSFSVVATGSPQLALQWQVCTDGVVWTDITDGGVYSGATTATLQLAGVPLSYNGYQYRCVASNALQAGVVSGVAVLTVNPKTITDPTQPGTTVPKTGDNGSIMSWIILTLAPPCGVGALWFYRKKKERADLA